MVHPTLKKSLRTAQTYWPGAADIKYFFQLNYRTILNKPFDYDFDLLKYFTPPRGTVFLDIGANRGQSIAAIRLFHPKVPIIAFEPRTETYRRLERYAAHMANLSLVQGGLSDGPGRFTLYTPVYRGYVFDGLASTLREEAEGWLSAERLYYFDRSKLEIREETVTLATLDSYDLRPSFMKLDVQGAVEKVLRGGLATIAEHAPIMLIEQSPGSGIERLLAPLGYTAYRDEQDALHAGAAGMTNAVFVPERRKADLTLPIG
jgi:FkbM family methyltransferase